MDPEINEPSPSSIVQPEQAPEVGPNDVGSGLNATKKLQSTSDFVKDNDSSEENEDEEDVVAPTWSRNKKRTQFILESDSDNDEENRAGPERIVGNEDHENDKEENDGSSSEKLKIEEQRITEKYKSLLDSDTESEDGNEEKQDESDNGPISEQLERELLQPAKRNEVPKRMSAKQAMEQMKTIKSETQRLHRENYVTIPYHQPKQFSLKEFMNRKTISKPNLKDHQKRFSLKMSPEELEVFAKQLEEREKEANDFFKSEKNAPDDLEDHQSIIDCTDSGAAHNVDAKNESGVSNKLKQIAINVGPETQDNFLSTQKKIDNSQNEFVGRTEEGIATGMQDSEMQGSDCVVNDSQFSKVFASQQSDDQCLSGTCESVIVPETEESVQFDPAENDFADPLKVSEGGVIMSPKEVMRDMLKERNAAESPSLKGSAHMLIDLETGDVVAPEPTGPDKLLQRFIKHATKKKPKDSTSMSIVSAENGKVEITNVSVALKDEEVCDKKPGAAYLKLKEGLMKVIMKRRIEEFQKRAEESKANEKEGYENEVDDAGNEQYFIDEDEELIDQLEGEEPAKVEIDENEKIKSNIEERKQTGQDDENIDADDEYDSEEGDFGDDDSNSEDDDDELAEDTKLIKTRIIKAFDDSDDENEKNDVINADVEKNDRLWQEGEKRNLDEEDELLGLCSGRFEATQRNSVISQIPITQRQDTLDDPELLALCSGTFQDGTQVPIEAESQADKTPITAPKRLESSDEDEGSHDKVGKKKQKRIRKLGFSDDEDEEETKLNANENDEKNSDENDEDELNDDHADEINQDDDEVPETYIDYDSEENEIEVQLTKNDRREKATEFFENEAELSESEWGSADEDEKDLDRYEMDLADEEEFDGAKLQRELGKIHMRRVLDDDIREVKKLQEMLIEDEETDGIGRQRKFRWQFMDEDFDLGARLNDFEGGQHNVDDEEELLWRKMRYEREMLLEKNAAKMNLAELSLKTNLTSSSGKKITIVNMKAEAISATESTSPFLIAKTMNLSRGSFLTRDSATLSKLANMTRASGDQEAGAARALKAQNFVFAAINTPNQDKSLKRKLASKEQEACPSQKKKKKFRLIDQLA